MRVHMWAPRCWLELVGDKTRVPFADKFFSNQTNVFLCTNIFNIKLNHIEVYCFKLPRIACPAATLCSSGTDCWKNSQQTIKTSNISVLTVVLTFWKEIYNFVLHARFPDFFSTNTHAFTWAGGKMGTWFRSNEVLDCMFNDSVSNLVTSLAD